jgi:sulfate transport system ATP-binding protein
LDARVRQDLRVWIDELHRELGITSVLVTHDQEEALELAHKVVVMHEGHLEQTGSPSDVYDRPETPFVAGFVGSANVLSGLVIDGRVQFGDYHVAGATSLSDGTAAHAYVRPHDIAIETVASANGSLPGTVHRVANLGWTSKLSVTLADGQELQAEIPNSRLDGIRPGSDVYVDLRNAKVFELGGSPLDELASL